MAKRIINKGIDRDMEKASEILRDGNAKVNNLTLLRPPTVTTPISLPTTADISSGTNILDIAAQKEADRQRIAAEYEAEMRRRYDYILNTPLASLTSEGIVVDPEYQGSIAKKTTDAERQLMIVPKEYATWLALDWIQTIENEKGQPGALFLHMQEPEIAKNTAGYDSGSSATTTNNRPPVVPPIPEVETLPPVTRDTSGQVTFEPDAGGGDITDLGGGITSAQQNLAGIVGGGKYWWLWYAAAALVVILYLKFRKK